MRIVLSELPSLLIGLISTSTFIAFTPYFEKIMTLFIVGVTIYLAGCCAMTLSKVNDYSENTPRRQTKKQWNGAKDLNVIISEKMQEGEMKMQVKDIKANEEERFFYICECHNHCQKMIRPGDDYKLVTLCDIDLVISQKCYEQFTEDIKQFANQL